jgi:hypothetical protein
LFHVEKYVEEHGTAGEAGKKMLKTLMFFECCPKPFGCTVSDTLDVSVIVFFFVSFITCFSMVYFNYYWETS